MAGQALINSLNPHATKAAVELLLKGTEQGLKWQARAAALALLGALAKAAPSVSWGYGAGWLLAAGRQGRAGQGRAACCLHACHHTPQHSAALHSTVDLLYGACLGDRGREETSFGWGGGGNVRLGAAASRAAGTWLHHSTFLLF